MKYLILEDGRIVDSAKTIAVEGKGYVPELNLDTRTMTKISIIDKTDSINMAQQRLIEYCVKKDKALIALWVKNLKRRVSVQPLCESLTISRRATKSGLIVELVNLNMVNMSGHAIDEYELERLAKRVKDISEGKEEPK